jgi:DNA sulfur modification protein DndC
MLEAMKSLREKCGRKLLMLTGVRLGESAARDQRIALSCGKNGAECGQGWLQVETPEAIADTLAPILHWRVCFVWDWLFFHAPAHGFPTQLVAESYGGDEAQEVNARTGCAGCNLASRDVALENIVQIPKWKHLAPLFELRDLYAELKKPWNRLRKDGNERRKDGTLVSNPCRMGPLTFEARLMGLTKVKDIQERARVDLINAEEEKRIMELIESKTWPDRWDGSEPLASVPFDNVNPDGSIQPQLFYTV